LQKIEQYEHRQIHREI